MKANYLKSNAQRLLLINLIIIALVAAAFFSINSNEFVTVKALAMNVRKGPGIDYDIMAQVKRGDKLEIIAEQDQWYQVKIDNKHEGWVASWLVEDDSSSPSTNIQAIVNTANTKLREEPNTESHTLKELKKNTAVTITSESNGWSYVETKTLQGWIYSELLTVADQKDLEIDSQKLDKLYAKQDGTKIRDTSSIEGNIVSEINFGDALKYMETEGDWYKVSTKDGKTGYVANWVVASNKPNDETSKVTSIAEATILLDPGHGGSDVGAESADGTIYEKKVTLATARYIQKELRKHGANIILTRDEDEFIPLTEIALKSNRAKADVFISLHYDSTDTVNQATGTTTYYYQESVIPLATVVNEQLATTLPLTNRGVEFGDYQVLRENERPAILLELGYMNNDEDVAIFKTKKYQSQVAKAVTEALVAYFSQ